MMYGFGERMRCVEAKREIFLNPDSTRMPVVLSSKTTTNASNPIVSHSSTKTNILDIIR
jgi:hypothetical protein